ncbi:MAG TPA: SEC-C metal-binding domain-containing protein [Ktedonobacteraceae bacterium]|jgi:preprotein translocase subunit SecA|nr:SEC-C metal-binding domain-containing protein [Ktedonobacteraceae bacterium]
MQLLGKMLGDPNKKELKAIQPLVDKINELEPAMEQLSDDELAAKTEEFRAQLYLYLKGGMVLENELVKLFAEALEAVEPLASTCSDAQLHAAMNEPRQFIERKRDPEYYLRDHLQDTLSETFENAYQNLNPILNAQRISNALDLLHEREARLEDAEDPQRATLDLLKEVEPALDKIDDDFLEEAFQKPWARFEAVRGYAAGDDSVADAQIMKLFGDILNALQEELVAVKAEQMDELLPEMVKRYKSGKTLDDLLPEAFAVVREAGRRTIQMRHYDVQLIGGVVLHQGKIAEMRTGEGKTLVATLPAYLNALPGKGVHVVTVNDYLAKRDAEWMGHIYKFLGLTVGVIVNAVNPQTPQRRAQYQADITYGTNNEFGFDYLRDNMVGSLEQMVQRDLNYAIVDEVDNILIDEARTPLIISGQGQESTDHYRQFAQWARRLKPETDYTVEEKTRTVILTEEGIEKIEKMAGIDNIYDEGNVELTRYMENAIKAEVIFKRDKDYIVKDGEVIIVDEFTGRQMPGRRYSEGLHQAIEAKENVKVQRENHTLATITFQNFFRLYEKLAGMTGTALTEAEELHKIYKLDVVVIPTHKPMIRKDLPDLIYRTTEAKYQAVVEEIKARHEKALYKLDENGEPALDEDGNPIVIAQGQPVLIGTTSVENSEYLSRLLDRQGIPHNVLNAKHHEREAQIVAQAGSLGAVTIATNMAGRGTDILLGGNPAGYRDSILRKHAEQVDFIREMPERTPDEREEKEEAIRQYIENMKEEEIERLMRQKELECEEDHKRVVELGGLHIIGTERHESRRIDNQLRGRAGRQGDPGSSRFYLSLEDELMRRFAAERVSKLMQRVGMDDDVPLESGLVSRFIEQAQTSVEGYNFDIRKNVVEYDDVIAKQREVIYADRRAVLERADMHERVLDMIRAEVKRIVQMQIPGNVISEEEELDNLITVLETWVHIPDEILPENLHAVRRDDLSRRLVDFIVNHYEERGKELDKRAKEHPEYGIPTVRDIERSVILQVIDRLWMDHIDALDVLRSSIHFRSVGQRDPLVEFKNEAYLMFDQLKEYIQHYVVDQLLKILPNLLSRDFSAPVERPAPKRKAPLPARPNVKAIATANGQSKTRPGNAPVPSAASRAQNAGNRSNGQGQRRAVATSSTQSPVVVGKVGRNDPCPCGSGKKYKKCHGA